MEYTATIFRSGQAVASNEAGKEKTLLIWAGMQHSLVSEDILIISKYVGRDKNNVKYYERCSKWTYNGTKWVKRFL